MSMLRMTEEQFAALKQRSKKPAVKAATKPKAAGDRYPDMLAAQIAAAGLPTPEREHKWHPTRRFRADLAWPATKFIVEVDGAVHRIKGKFERDIERHNLLIQAGWVYIRVTPEMVRTGEALTWVREFVG